MAKKEDANVTMRVRIGENELEVSGPKNFVDKKITEFLKTQQNQQHIPIGKPKGSKTGIETPPKGKPMSVAQFFRKMALKTDVDRILAAGYYLERHKNFENFTAFEAKEIIRTAKINPPTNPNAVVAKNIRKGLMMSAGDKDSKKAFVLTTDGEDAINEMLKE